jgi:hypothetical protein
MLVHCSCLHNFRCDIGCLPYLCFSVFETYTPFTVHFNIFFLSLPLGNLTTICLGVVFFMLLVFAVHGSVDLAISSNFETSSHCFFKCFFSPPTHSLGDSDYTLISLVKVASLLLKLL